MALRIVDNFWKLVARKAFQYVPPASLSYDNTVSQTFDADIESLIERQNGNVATVLRVIVNSLVWLPWLIKEVDISSGKEELIEGVNDELSMLLYTPNPILSQAEFRTYIVQSLLLTGNSFIAKEFKDQAKSVPYELWPMQTMRMSVVTGEQGRPSGYVCDRNTAYETKFGLDEIIHIKMMNINDPFYGRSPMMPMMNQLLSDYYAEKWNVNHFKNSAVPGSMFTPKNPMKADQAKEVKVAWDGQMKGVNKAHQTFINPIPGELHIFESALKDAGFLQLLDLNREKIFSAWGVGPALGGVYRYANYSNVNAQMKIMYDQSVKPHDNNINDKLNRQLVIPHFGEDFRITTDYSDVSALQEDKEVKARTHQILVNSGIETINEAREDYGMDGLAWGDDEPLPPEPPVIPGKEPNGEPVLPPPDDDGKTLKNIAIHHKSSPDHLLIWKTFDADVRPYEVLTQRESRRFFHAQMNRTVKKLKVFTIDGAMMSKLMWIKKGIDAKDARREIDDIFDLGAENETIMDIFSPIYRKVLQGGGQKAFNKLRVAGEFDVTNPNVISAINIRKNKITYVNNTTYRMIQGVLADSYQEGASLGETEKMIRSMFSDMERYRSMRIARTEMSGGFNNGARLAYGQADVPKKIWVSTPDQYIRTFENGNYDHLVADGEEVNLNDPFIKTGGDLDHPGDASGDAGNIINCRCTMTAGY